jgi:hypothetical protein
MLPIGKNIGDVDQRLCSCPMMVPKTMTWPIRFITFTDERIAHRSLTFDEHCRSPSTRTPCRMGNERVLTNVACISLLPTFERDDE